MPKKVVSNKVRRATQAQIKSQVSAGESHTGTLVRRYKTKDGVAALELQGIPQLILEDIPRLVEQEWREAGKLLPKRPTYQVEVAGGEFETHEHDQTTLDTDEEKKAWRVYLERDDAFNTEINRRVLKAALAMGVVSISANKNTVAQWDESLKALGYKLTSNSAERKMMHIRMGVRNPEDIQEIFAAIMEMSGINQEVLARSREAFRGDVEGKD